MDKIIEDDSSAYFSVRTKPHLKCKRYQKCETVVVPFTEGRHPGGSGWLFPKRSPFLPVFKEHYWKLKEAGYWQRIENKP